MEYSNIRELLEKYWECETSLGEEAQLREFYAHHKGELPPDLREAAPLFQYYQATEEDTMPELFTDKPAPWEAAVITRPFWHSWMKYAAVLLMAAGLGYSVFSFQQRRDDPQEVYAMRDTFSDPQLAYQETQRALHILSKNLNKGKEQMEKLSYFHEATEMIQGNN